MYVIGAILNKQQLQNICIPKSSCKGMSSVSHLRLFQETVDVNIFTNAKRSHSFSTNVVIYSNYNILQPSRRRSNLGDFSNNCFFTIFQTPPRMMFTKQLLLYNIPDSAKDDVHQTIPSLQYSRLRQEWCSPNNCFFTIFQTPPRIMFTIFQTPPRSMFTKQLLLYNIPDSAKDDVHQTIASSQ